MDEQEKHPDQEVKRLRGCINDLVSLMALPALWSGGEPSQIARTLVDVLQRLLHLDLIYIELKGMPGDASVEVARVAPSPETAPQAREIGAELHRLLGDDPDKWQSQATRGFNDSDMCIVPLRLGLRGEIGVVVAGAERADFPGQTEALLLRVAANQVVLSLHEARLLSEQKRLANELDQRVALRTAELDAATRQLKQSQQELSRTEERTRLIIDTALDAVVTMDAAGTITSWNKQAEVIFGWSTAEAIGARMSDLIIPQSQRLAHERGVRHFLATGEGALLGRRIEMNAIRRGDIEFPVELEVIPMKLGGDWVFSAFLRDITDSKQAEEALRNTQAELANMTRVMTMGQLTASIAHEVNQPLSGIITNAGTCLRMLDADPPNVEGARETARRTIRDGNRASEVITRLRSLFSRRQATTEPVDLNEAAKEVIALLSSRLQRDDVILRCELADDLPLVAGDRVQLQQVIMNMLQNASDAMIGLQDRPRQLFIQTQRDETDCVRLTVRDSGIGLGSQAASKLFDAFYTTKNGGMGIGLSVSRWIVENHEGRIWAQPNDGPGATFSFSIPCRQARLASG